MKPPSGKQVAFAKTISVCLNIPMPTEESAGAYWQFINDNINEYCRYKISVRQGYDEDMERYKERRRHHARQKEADWATTYLSAEGYAQYVHEGGIRPSWSSQDERSFYAEWEEKYQRDTHHEEPVSFWG